MTKQHEGKPFHEHPLHDEWMRVVKASRTWRHDYCGNNANTLRQAVDRLEWMEGAVLRIAEQIESTRGGA